MILKERNKQSFRNATNLKSFLQVDGRFPAARISGCHHCQELLEVNDAVVVYIYILYDFLQLSFCRRLAQRSSR